ncbi:MAG: phosphotransferase [Proteobacteria bacterium]|nr:phosphotransferase [Pseudomonadota bacterium]
MSGKEAQVFLVEVDGDLRVAKIYKSAENRSFKHRAVYTEGRRVRNSRQQRAMAKRSRYGRAEEEQAWKNAEVDAIYRLRDAGVRVPEPFAFVDGVLVMELIADEWGEPAPRLIDVQLSAEEATDLFQTLLREVVKMLCAGLVHGDLSDFNVLLTADGPVIIDFPQAVDATANNSAQRLLIRDVRNLQSFLARFVPDLRRMEYGQEMWELFEAGKLLPDTKLTGKARKRGKANTEAILMEIQAAVRDERSRREALGLDPIPEGDSPTDPMVERMLQRAREERAGGGKKKKKKRGDGESGSGDGRQPNRGEAERGRGRGGERQGRGGGNERGGRDRRDDGDRNRGGDRSRGGDRNRGGDRSRGGDRGRGGERARQDDRGRRDSRGRGRPSGERTRSPRGGAEERGHRDRPPQNARARKAESRSEPKPKPSVDFSDLDALLGFDD